MSEDHVEKNYLNTPQKKLADILWQQAVIHCHGRLAVKEALQKITSEENYAVLSIGKAASAMTLGALDVIGPTYPYLTITKAEHTDNELTLLSHDNENIQIFESSHPVPDQRSLAAGQLAINFIGSLSKDTHLITLISGGASALCEYLPANKTLSDLQTLTEHMLTTGATIKEINTARSKISLIKQGKLLKNFQGKSVSALLISDVAGDDPTTIASGIALYPEDIPKDQFSHNISMIRKNADGCAEAARLAKQIGLPVIESGNTLFDDVFECADIISRTVKNGPDGIYIFGGEPTVELPPNPGEGGRNQCLALILARDFRNTEHIGCLVAGTDGTDGPTEAAGGIIDGTTYTCADEVNTALTEANSGAYLRSQQALYYTGPTGTNVMDICVCVKLPEHSAQQALHTYQA